MLILPGDVCPVDCHIRSYQEEWLSNEFAEWINGLNYRNEDSRVVMCAGNHDFWMENLTESKEREWLSHIKDNRLIYLDNELYTFEYMEAGEMKAVTLFGCPYCKVFGSWAFMRENLEKYYSPIPEGVDILFTHDAADINNLGLIQMGAYSGTNAGNKALAKHVRRVSPKYYFCGHIHSGNHELEEIDGVKMANVSIMDEHYRPTHKPLVIDYEEVPGIVYPLLGNYEETDENGVKTHGTDLIGIFSTHEKARNMIKSIEAQGNFHGYYYETFEIHSFFVL